MSERQPLKHHEWYAGDGRTIHSERWAVVELTEWDSDGWSGTTIKRMASERFHGTRGEAESELQERVDKWPRDARNFAIVQVFIPIVTLTAAKVEYTEES